MVSTRWPDGGVVTQRTANPCTPVRFRLGPPPPCLSDRVPRGYPFNLLTMRTGLADLPCPLSCWSASIAWSASRSEEHTSELQSLMRISYAVFCLTKNINTKHT